MLHHLFVVAVVVIGATGASYVSVSVAGSVHADVSRDLQLIAFDSLRLFCCVGGSGGYFCERHIIIFRAEYFFYCNLFVFSFDAI